MDLSDHYSPQMMRMAVWTIVVATVVLGLKFYAWMLTGSIALYSDAMESIVNVVTAVAALWALQVARRPADENHPLGHQKIEYLAAVLEGGLITLAAVFIVQDAIAALITPVPTDLGPVAIGVSISAAALNWFWARRLIRVGRAARSAVLEADGRHLLADVVTTVGVLVGLGLATWTGIQALDPLMAIAVAVYILRQGWLVVRASLAGLLDEALDPEEIEEIAQIIEVSGTQAIEIHDLVTRRSGPVTFIEFHLIVDGDMAVRDSHAICDRIERALRTSEPRARITIHVEPEEMAKPTGRPIP